MRHHHCAAFVPHSPDGRGSVFGRHLHRHRHGGRHGHRMFDFGELRLLLLDMIAEQPRHGYELIRALEERTGGSYTPSPGVIYPTLSWLEDAGYATVETEGGRKSYRLTEAGAAFRAENAAAIAELSARLGGGDGPRREGIPAPVLRAMENLKLAMRLRLRSGPIGADAATAIAAALDAAAHAIESSASSSQTK